MSWELVEMFAKASLVGGVPSFCGGTAAPLLVELSALVSLAWDRSVDIDIKFRRSGR